MADLRKFIKNKKLTQAKAAVDSWRQCRSRVSDLIRGKWEQVQVMEMLNRSVADKSRHAYQPKKSRIKREVNESFHSRTRFSGV